MSRDVLHGEWHNVLRLIRDGEDTNRLELDGRSLLMNMCRIPSIHGPSKSIYNKVFEKLILYSAQVDLQDASGVTALAYAVYSLAEARVLSNGQTQLGCIEMLLDYGADVNIADVNSETALSLAVKCNLYDCVEMFTTLDSANLKRSLQFESVNPLLLASTRRSVAVVDKLATRLVDVGVHDSHGNCPIMLALSEYPVQSQRDKDDVLSVCHMLINSGFSVNSRNSRGVSALMCAVSVTSCVCLTDIFELLIGEGAKLELADNSGAKALDHALASHSAVDVVDKTVTWLLENGAEPVIGQAHHKQLCQLIGKLCRLPKRERVDEWVVDSLQLSYLVQNDRADYVRLVTCSGLQDLSLTCANICAVLPNLSPLVCALVNDRLDIARYFLASTCVISSDLRPAEFLKPFLSTSALTFMQDIRAQPWPLVKLAFVAVSSAVGSGSCRVKAVGRLQLPARLKRMLLFQEPVCRLCVHEWDDIPMCFYNYDVSQRLRPLLYYWPFGQRNLSSCEDCQQKGRTDMVTCQWEGED